MWKKILLSFLSLAIILGLLETGARIYEKYQISGFPSVPDSPDGFGNFKNMSLYGIRLGQIENRVAGSAIEYSAYSGVQLKPNFFFKLNNFISETNSLGFFRTPELSVPKSKEEFRIFILGGSTIQGGYNESWAISNYLEGELKKNNPNVFVVNAGVSGYTSENEFMLLQTKILRLQPDLVIILDGTNDLYYSASPFSDTLGGQTYYENQQVLNKIINYPNSSAVISYWLKTVLKKSAAATEIFRALFRKDIPEFQEAGSVSISDNAVNQYIDNLHTIKAILEDKKIPGIFIFQPVLGYCKDEVSDYEKTTIAYIKEESKSSILDEIAKFWPRASKDISLFPQSSLVKTVDFSCLFKNKKGTMYLDSVHYSPVAAQIIGEEIARAVKEEF